MRTILMRSWKLEVGSWKVSFSRQSAPISSFVSRLSSFLLASALWLLASLCAAPLSAQTVGMPTSVVNTKHNLSAKGPGSVKAATEQEVCIFCHTPHNANPEQQPLWNRTLPISAYKTYTSNSLKALPGQPTGNSKLCLSCHDGTIALGSVLSRSQQIQMAGAVTTLPPGASNLGTDLSDDHPISFVYDSTLVTKNPKLKDPAQLTGAVRLDGDRNLQCTTCHDAHNNQYGSFLVTSNSNSQLCNTCHTMSQSQTQITQHAQCNACHQTHSAPSGPYLLAQAKVSDTCLTCHSGAVGPNQGTNVGAAINAAYSHDTKSAVNLTNHIPNNSDCKDCHEPHTMVETTTPTAAPGLPASLGAIDGVSITGAALKQAQYGYEVCFKCHADNAATLTGTVSRKIVQTNLRLQFAPSAVSFHPVAVKGLNTNVPSLRPPYTITSMVACTDCHGSDSSKAAGGLGGNGPHGSSYPGILLARYDTADFTPYSTTAYALCFNCHDNTQVVADSGPFPWHDTHVNKKTTPCSACHDSHGISSAQGNNINNFALINFDTSICFPDDVTHRLEFDHTGTGHGTCYVKCHGTNHSGTTY